VLASFSVLLLSKLVSMPAKCDASACHSLV